MVEPDSLGLPVGLTKLEQVHLALKINHPGECEKEDIDPDLMEALLYEAETDP